MKAIANILKRCGLTATVIAASAWSLATLSAQPLEDLVFSTEKAVLSEAPNVPPPVLRTHAAKVIVNLEVKEVTKHLADGVDYTFWTFGGNVPGSFIRVREGDFVEFHLHNNQDNKMPHNIDLHAVTGPGGGAAASFTAPGHSSQFTFQTLKPGLYVYHCATAPVGMHVANGMYGMIFVQPKEGMPPVDHEYYVMQGEFYTRGKFGEPGLQTFDLDKAVDERPSYVVFNGAVGSLTGSNALTAQVGERVRIFVGNGGPNLSSSFHLIGAIFDTVYAEGGSAASHHVQTTEVPPGGAAIVEFTAAIPGNYTLVDHSLFRAFNKGAMGTLTVTGPDNRTVYSGKQADSLYTGAPIPAALPISVPFAPVKTAFIVAPSLSDQYLRGQAVYMRTCFVCHQPNGLGVSGQIPPLAGSDALMSDKTGAIRGVIQGRPGPVTVNGRKYTVPMIPVTGLTDQEIADVITYVRNSWGNSDTNSVTAREVADQRKTATVALSNSYE